MSSKIQVQRICQQCGNDFTARTTVTKYCGDYCAKMAYKDRVRQAKIEKSNEETAAIVLKPLQDIKRKEFLTVREVALLLSCSIRSVYKRIDANKIKAVNLSQRLTRIKRSDIDKLFT